MKNSIHGFSYGDPERKTVTIHFNEKVPVDGYSVKELIRMLKKVK